MYNGTLLINPITNRVNGFIHRVLESGENGTLVPHFLMDSDNNITGISYLNPIKFITGYQYYSELRYKTYNPQTNTFI